MSVPPLCLHPSVTPSLNKGLAPRNAQGGEEGEEDSGKSSISSHFTDGKAEAQGRSGAGPRTHSEVGQHGETKSQARDLKPGLRFDLRWGSGFRKAPGAAVTGQCAGCPGDTVTPARLELGVWVCTAAWLAWVWAGESTFQKELLGNWVAPALLGLRERVGAQRPIVA